MPSLRDMLPPPPWELFKEEYSPEDIREREARIKAAGEVIASLQPLRPKLQAIYDKVKYGVSGAYWPGAREKAAILVNSLGDLEFELTEIIEKEGKKRGNR